MVEVDTAGDPIRGDQDGQRIDLTLIRNLPYAAGSEAQKLNIYLPYRVPDAGRPPP